MAWGKKSATENSTLLPVNQGPPMGVEKHLFFAEHGVHFDKAKRCFENSIFCRVAVKEGSLFICLVILTLQLFSPTKIMLANLHNLEVCLTWGSDLAMPWDIQFQNLLFVILVWQAIINDTAKSITAFALLFINRLDEDFGKLEDVLYIATKAEEGLDHEEEDAEGASRYFQEYGPWSYEWLSGCQKVAFGFITAMCRVMWLLSLVLPSIFLYCGF